MPIGERMLRIIEKLGILVAITFDSSKNERVNKIFEESHIGMTLFTTITSINICISLLITAGLLYHLRKYRTLFAYNYSNLIVFIAIVNKCSIVTYILATA